MVGTVLSNGSVNGSIASGRRRSDLPPSYETVEAEPHGFIDGAATRKTPRLPPRLPPRPEPLMPGGVPSNDFPTQNDVKWDSLFLDPAIGEPRVAYTAPDELLAQCAQYGHVKKTKYSAWGILAATLWFPWGLLCLMGSRLVYCERCGLVLRDPRKHRDTRREHRRARHLSRSHGCGQRARCQSRRP